MYKKVRRENGAVDYVFKVGDFGLGRTYLSGQPLTAFPQTPHYQDPSLNGNNYSPTVDLFSFACLMENLAVRMAPGTTDAELTEIFQNLREKREPRHTLESIIEIATTKLEQMSTRFEQRAK